MSKIQNACCLIVKLNELIEKSDNVELNNIRKDKIIYYKEMINYEQNKNILKPTFMERLFSFFNFVY